MPNKDLFKTSKTLNVPVATAINEAGGVAYAMPAKHALAQLTATGTFNNTYYATAEDQLTKVLELVRKVEPEFVAKCAIYAREQGFMKDMPAFLCAYLVSIGQNDLGAKVFHKVMDNAKMVRNFVQFLRSGVLGRKSLGTRPKKLVQQWLASQTDSGLFRGSVGNSPSLVDVIKMTHPRPATPERENLYKYLLDKEYDVTKLPAEVQAFEAFKKESGGTPPNVPFEMLTALPLTEKQWVQIAKNASWTQTRMNLNTMQRHGVFNDKSMEKEIAAKLTNTDLIKKAKVFPYQLMAAYLNADDKVPMMVTNALQDAMEIAVENIPTFDGKVYVFPDISGSMSSPVTGIRKGATSKVTCHDVSALFASAILRKNPTATIVPFGTNIVNVKLNPRDSIMTNAKILKNFNGGGTNCAAPLQLLNREHAKADLCIYVSDNESWLTSSSKSTGMYRSQRGTQTMAEWLLFKKRNPKAKLVCIDIQPYDSLQAPDDRSVLNVGGFSDNVFSVIKAFSSSNGESHWTDEINKVELYS